MVATALLMACAPAATTVQRLPEGVEVHLDQSRILRKTRTVFVRLHNGSPHELVIERFVLTSPRFDDVSWRGSEVVGAGFDTDLQFAMPTGRCGGEGLNAALTITYRIGTERFRSIAHPSDRYGAATAFVDRDCAEQSVRAAAAMEIGELRVDGSGRTAVLELPVTFTPTGRRLDVTVTGFGSTVLFDVEPTPMGRQQIRLTGETPVTVDLRITPHRCDAHALADDKVGTLLPVQVRSADLPENSGGEFYLPLGSRRRAAMLSYYGQTCGLTKSD